MKDILLTELIEEIQDKRKNLLKEVSMGQVIQNSNIAIIRSAKETVLCMLLEHLKSIHYSGVIHVIGRQSDYQFVEEFHDLDVRLFIVDEQEKYSVENTCSYLESVKPDVVCFLYQQVISDNHNNLLEIINKTGCTGYGISNKLQVMQLKELEKFLVGNALYSNLCDWFYLKDRTE